MMHAMLPKTYFARLAAVCTAAWPMGVVWANDQLDQIEVMLAKQRAQQQQLGQLIKQAQDEAGHGPSWSVPTLPELTMQSVMLSAALIAVVLMGAAMLWLWKNRMPSSVAYRPVPEPYFKESAYKPSGYKDSGYVDSAVSGLDVLDTAEKTSAFKPSAFKTSGYKDSGYKDSSAKDFSTRPAGFRESLQDSSWSESWAADTSPLSAPAAPSASLSATSSPSPIVDAPTPSVQPDISLDDLESGFGAPVMDFDLSDFDHISSPAPAEHDPFTADPFVAPSIENPAGTSGPASAAFTDIVVPATPAPAALAPLTVADFDLVPIQVDSEDFTDSTAVFIAGEVDHRDSAFDLLKFDPAAPFMQPQLPDAGNMKPRASVKIDSEVPSKYDDLKPEPLRHAVAYVAPADSYRGSKPPPDSGFTGSAFGQFQLETPPEILPYPHELSDDDATFATQLDLAREFAELGQTDEAELLCQEVFTNGTEAMREYALYILTRLPEFKRK